MKNYRGLLAYEGTRYLGWQKTREGPSIQEELEKAISHLLQKETIVEAASRTDAGVHARGQVIQFFSDQEMQPARMLRGINALLPRDIVLHELKPTRSDFHPTLEAKGKEYHYDLVLGPTQPPFARGFSWHVPYGLDIALMREGAAELIGEHDFSAFCNERALLDIDPLCSLWSIAIDALEDHQMRIRVIGNRFLYKMVRNLAGTLVYIGCGKLIVSNLREILQAKKRALAGMTAPAEGLFLHQVLYEAPLSIGSK